MEYSLAMGVRYAGDSIYAIFNSLLSKQDLLNTYKSCFAFCFDQRFIFTHFRHFETLITVFFLQLRAEI